MPSLDLGSALRAAHGADPAAIPDVVLRLLGELGGTDVVVYLVDFAQTTLEPLPDRSTHANVTHSEEVATTIAGRAFADQRPVTAERPDGVRVWVPINEGSDRTGVLAVTLPEMTDDAVTACQEIGLFTGYLIATQARSTDLYNLHRRRRSLSVPASMQWDLLPPLVLKTGRAAIAAVLEPAYEVGGDCFDYALNDPVLDVAVFDPVGHGVRSALIAALCMGSYRHDRREGHTLEQMHEHLDVLLTREFSDREFATGQLARIDLDTGTMTWTNAGHPLPMLIRGGQLVSEIECSPTTPWGLGDLVGPSGRATVATEALEPGDAVLFYTDGVVEAHQPGADQFGAERLADLIGRHSSDQLEPEEILRRLVRAVLEHQHDRLGDDATLVLVQWNGRRSP
ncbi:MAG: serine/threonine-protein phosphatase [Actinobacteria bacterium]|nr:serine/threonine-protein phosphatase [Actinomycetota bacterium]